MEVNLENMEWLCIGICLGFLLSWLFSLWIESIQDQIQEIKEEEALIPNGLHSAPDLSPYDKDRFCALLKQDSTTMKFQDNEHLQRASEDHQG